MPAFVAARMGDPNVQFGMAQGAPISWPDSIDEELHHGIVVDAIYPTRVGARRGRAVYLVHTSDEAGGDEWCVLVDGDPSIHRLCQVTTSDERRSILDLLLHFASCHSCLGAMGAIANALPSEPTDPHDVASTAPSVADVFRSLIARVAEEERRVLSDQFRKLRDCRLGD